MRQKQKNAPDEPKWNRIASHMLPLSPYCRIRWYRFALPCLWWPPPPPPWPPPLPPPLPPFWQFNRPNAAWTLISKCSGYLRSRNSFTIGSSIWKYNLLRPTSMSTWNVFYTHTHKMFVCWFEKLNAIDLWTAVCNILNYFLFCFVSNLGRLRAIDVQCDGVLMEVKCQRAYYRCFVDIWHIEMLRMDYRIRCYVHRDPHLLAIQEEWELMLERWEINHEQRLDSNLKFTSWPSVDDRDEGERGGKKNRENWKQMFFSSFSFWFFFFWCKIEFWGFQECVYLMCRNDITKSSFINCSNSVDDAKWQEENWCLF